jgi:hypothetical protein
MRAEVVGGEVAFGPGEELVEAGAVVVDQGEEERVALAFGGGQSLFCGSMTRPSPLMKRAA